jgi:hypothetical protein
LLSSSHRLKVSLRVKAARIGRVRKLGSSGSLASRYQLKTRPIAIPSFLDETKDEWVLLFMKCFCFEAYVNYEQRVYRAK